MGLCLSQEERQQQEEKRNQEEEERRQLYNKKRIQDIHRYHHCNADNCAISRLVIASLEKQVMKDYYNITFNGDDGGLVCELYFQKKIIPMLEKTNKFAVVKSDSDKAVCYFCDLPITRQYTITLKSEDKEYFQKLMRERQFINAGRPAPVHHHHHSSSNNNNTNNNIGTFFLGAATGGLLASRW